MFLTSVLGGNVCSAMSLSLYSRGKSSPANDWTELGWAICRRQDNRERSLAAQEAGGEYITARTSTGLKTGPQRLTVAIMDRIGPTRMATARTPKEFFCCCQFYCIVLVGAGCPPMLAHYFALHPTGASFGSRGWGTQWQQIESRQFPINNVNSAEPSVTVKMRYSLKHGSRPSMCSVKTRVG